MRKRLVRSLAACCALLLVVGGCSSEKKLQLDDGDGPLYQLEMPQAGDEVAVFHTSMGNVTVRFFAEEAPKAVENFLTHAKDGYYDGLLFFRVINGFMIQSGSPENRNVGGESIWGKAFEDEFSPKLHNLRGALCMANSGADSNQSQFFIVQSKTLGEGYEESMRSAQKQDAQYGYTDKIIQAYTEQGGCPWLDRKHTVFGQVIEGIEIIDQIARSRVDENDRPVTDVVIESVEVITYAG